MIIRKSNSFVILNLIGNLKNKHFVQFIAFKILTFAGMTISIISLLISSTALSQQTDLFERWNKTDLLIMNNKLSKNAAIDSMRMYVPLAVADFKSRNAAMTDRKDWVFPMKGWTKVTYRANGDDYRDELFDYFQGGESMSHPAHDIFILDKDSNGLEDSTGQKVLATAMVTGIVFTEYSDFKTGDFLRAGNYVKIFDPKSEAMFYYCHLDSVFVVPGQIVTSGEPIGYVGRTGRKAVTGKTHIHIAYYKIIGGYPKPENILEDLYKTQKKMKR